MAIDGEGINRKEREREKRKEKETQTQNRRRKQTPRHQHNTTSELYHINKQHILCDSEKCFRFVTERKYSTLHIFPVKPIFVVVPFFLYCV